MSDMLGGLRCSYYDKMGEGLERPEEAWRGRWFMVRFVILDEKPLAVLAALYTSMDP